MERVGPTLVEQIPIDRRRHYCGIQNQNMPEEHNHLPEQVQE